MNEIIQMKSFNVILVILFITLLNSCWNWKDYSDFETTLKSDMNLLNEYKIVSLDSVSKGVWGKVGIFHGPVFPEEVEKILNIKYKKVIQDDGCTYYIFVKGNNIIKEEISCNKNIEFFIISNSYIVLNSNDTVYIKKFKHESGYYFKVYNNAKLLRGIDSIDNRDSQSYIKKDEIDLLNIPNYLDYTDEVIRHYEYYIDKAYNNEKYINTVKDGKNKILDSLIEEYENLKINEIEYSNSEDSLMNLKKPYFRILQNCYPEKDVTSGRMNKPEMIVENEFEDKYYGFYSFTDINSKLNPPNVALAFVSFNKLPWKFSDKNQKLIMLIVLDKSFKCGLFSFYIDDNIKKVNDELQIIKSIDNINYYNKDNMLVAVLVENEKITKYLMWYDDIHSTDNIILNHEYIKTYLLRN